MFQLLIEMEKETTSGAKQPLAFGKVNEAML
jgi:hypothetical protein